MLRPIERDEVPSVDARAASGAQSAESIVPVVDQADFDAPLLPSDHPRWARDTLTLSARAKEMIARLKPVVVRIMGFWDHRVRSAVVAGARLCIDASGSYRIQH